MDGTESAFSCPLCHKVSHNENDVRERYCGNCRVFVDDVLQSAPSVRAAMSRMCVKLAEVRPHRAAAHMRSAAVWGDRPEPVTMEAEEPKDG